MLSRTGILLILIILTLMSFSCSKIEQPETQASGDLSFEALPDADSIPLKFGTLVSVSSLAGYPYWLQLWFEDKDGKIRMVRYNLRENYFATNFHLIPRK